MKHFLLLFILIASNVCATDLLVFDAKELLKASKETKAGDRIILAESGQWKDVQVKLKLNDSTLTTEAPGKVAFTGNSSLEVIGNKAVIDGLTFRDGSLKNGHVLKIRGEHCHVTRCTFNEYNPTEPSIRYHWLSLQGHHHLVDYCRFSGHNHSGNTICVWLDEEEIGHHQISRNHFGPRAMADDNGFEVIRIGDSKTSMKEANCVVSHNLFENCDGEIEIISNKSCANQYLHNTILTSAGCLTLRHGNDCVVSHNIILGEGKKGTGGIRIVGENHVVSFNHIEGTDGRADGAISVSAGVVDAALNEHAQVKNLRIENNILFNNRGSNLVLGHGKGSHKRTLDPIGVIIKDNIEKETHWSRVGKRLSPEDVGPGAKPSK